jgi:acyl-CoA thioesterase YciA
MPNSNACMKDTNPNTEMLTSLPPGKEPTLRVVPMPADANFSGDIFGGWVMSHVDIAGSIPATRRARGRVATVAVNSFVFRQPVLVGDVVSFYAEVVKVGRTSITVDVQVYAQRNPVKEECVKVTEAALTYVAVDENGRPRVVPTQQSS